MKRESWKEKGAATRRASTDVTEVLLQVRLRETLQTRLRGEPNDVRNKLSQSATKPPSWDLIAHFLHNKEKNNVLSFQSTEKKVIFYYYYQLL